MYYEKELDFFLNILKKSRLSVNIIDPTTPMSESITPGVDELFGIDTKTTSFDEAVGGTKENVLYNIMDMFECKYVFMILPGTDKKKCMLIGPYKTELVSNSMILEKAEIMNLKPKQVNRLKRYYDEVPFVKDNDNLFAVLETFCEVIWEGKDYSYVKLNVNDELRFSPLSFTGESFDKLNPKMEMEMMQKRYDFENQFMEAVSRGQGYKADLFMKSFAVKSFEQRLPDTLRNSKNYMIIMNTLLRKAAEKGGVHPLHLNKISSQYAGKIERFINLRELPSFMRDMFQDYCDLVKYHSTKKYSKLITNVVVYIESNLGEDISLREVADKYGVSSSYLSKTFKDETGKNFVDYVNGKKIEMAKHLLKTTSLQVQTVAHHCGFLDMQYFSKVFKKYVNMTPREYRENKQIQNI